MKAKKDRLDSRSSRRRLPFTILAQANVLLADMNPIKMKLILLFVVVVRPLRQLKGHRLAVQTSGRWGHGRGSPGGGRLEGVGGGSCGGEVKGLS